jgi:hypothetical protein
MRYYYLFYNSIADDKEDFATIEKINYDRHEAMPTARAIATSPASLLPAHFVLFASIPIAFPYTAATHIVQAARPSHFQSLPKECRCPSPVMNDED